MRIDDRTAIRPLKKEFVLDLFEVLFRGPADGTDPVVGKVLEGRSGSHPRLGVALGWIVDVAANGALPL